MPQQIDMFGLLYETPKFSKPLALTTFFSGYDSQALALKYIGIPFIHKNTCEWAVKSIQALKDLHFGDDDTDYSKELDIGSITDFLFKMGISSNYNEPMSYDQIKRLSEAERRKIYNNIKATHNHVNIMNVKGSDLHLTNDETNLLFYSFPCQDISNAGLSQGLEEGSGTRSSLLFEVGRILKELDVKPDILIMENVAALLSEKHKGNLHKWMRILENMGYINYAQVMNTADFGIPQHRDRVFMVSIKGEANFQFPKKLKLRHRLKDLLEHDVDERFYLSEKLMDYIKAHENPENLDLRERERRSVIMTDNATKVKKETDVAGTLLARDFKGPSTYGTNMVMENVPNKIKEEMNLYEMGIDRFNRRTGSVVSTEGVSSTLLARNQGDNNMIVESKNGKVFKTKGTKQLDETIEKNEIKDGTCLDLYNRATHDDIAQTLDTGIHNSIRVAVDDSGTDS